MSSEEMVKHPSFGTIRTSRVSIGGKGTSLFGSSIKHGNVIRIEISTATLKRNLNRDWIHPEKEIIAVEMSETQFGNFVSSTNIYEGTPCTIRHIKGERIAEPTHEFERARFDREFNERMQTITEKCTKNMNNIEELLNKPTITKTDRKILSATMRSIIQEFMSNIPFVVSSYNEATEAITEAAKKEVEAFILARLNQYAGTALEAQLQAMLPGDE